MRILAQIELIPEKDRVRPSYGSAPIENRELPIVILDHEVSETLKNGKPRKNIEKVVEKMSKEAKKIFDDNFRFECRGMYGPHAKLVVSFQGQQQSLSI